MATFYRYAILDPRLQGAENNDLVFSTPHGVLGVEVTVPALAERCMLGNIDPQHSCHRETYDNDSGFMEPREGTVVPGEAAIEFAARQIMWWGSGGWAAAMIPPPGATLATVRADADSVGTMAVLTIMAETGRQLPAEAIKRVRLIAEADWEASGGWPGVRPVGRPAEFVGPIGPLSAVVSDFRYSLDERVALAKEYLLTGTFPGEEEIRDRLVTEAEAAISGLNVCRIGDIAVVVGDHRLAMGLGYRLRPVVVATNPSFCFGGGEPHLKHTVARWNSDVPADWDGLKAALAEREPGWGGSTSILGSPQGVGSVLTTEEVVKIVQRYLT